jgi:hypothetical protein
MKPQTKSFHLKALDDEGHGLARIATLSAVDSDGDTYAPGAFGEQFAVVRDSHSWQGVSLGKARIFEKGDEALAEFTLNLDTEAGREWHAALKFDLDAERSGGRPLQEWSYGFRILEATNETREGDRVRILKKLKVHEISPVLLGAGVGTGTLALKNAALKDERFEGLLAQLSEISAAVEADPTVMSAVGLKQLADLNARIGAVIAAASEAGTADARKAGQLAASFAAFKVRKRLKTA